jgi:hypothetical protein
LQTVLFQPLTHLSADWPQMVCQSVCPLTPCTLRKDANHEFLCVITVAGKNFKKIQETVKRVFGNKALKKTQIYDIKKVKEGKSATYCQW